MERYIKTDILAKIVFDKWQECDELKRIIPAMRNAIMSASTTDVRENVHAHFNKVKMKSGEWWHTCSKCIATWGSEDGELDFKFCPNCGAQFDERKSRWTR